MFEQESYDKATVQVESQPGGLFHNYEIKPWGFSPAIYKIIAASAILNFAFLAAVSQTNMLTARGCDSPWVGRVCQVVDMTYVGALLFGTEREYADVAYERTELSPEDEITYIIVPADKLEYPEGYFQIANPVQYAMLQQQAANGLNGSDIAGVQPGFSPIPNSDSDLLKIRPNPPAANPNAFQGDSSSPLFKVEDGNSTADNTFPRKTPRNRPGKNPVTKEPGEEVAKTPPIPPVNPPAPDEAKADENGVVLNKRPIDDQKEKTIAQVDAQQVKLDSPFKVTIAATLGLAKDGKTVVLKDPKLMPVDPNIPNDPALAKLAQEWILAVGDAGWLGYLDILDVGKKLKSKKILIGIEQNDKDFMANVRYELPSEEEARRAARGLSGYILLGKVGKEGDELAFLESARSTNETNTLVLNIQMQKPVVQQLIQRQLAKAREKKAEPSSTASSGMVSNTASK